VNKGFGIGCGDLLSIARYGENTGITGCLLVATKSPGSVVNKRVGPVDCAKTEPCQRSPNIAALNMHELVRQRVVTLLGGKRRYEIIGQNDDWAGKPYYERACILV